MNAVFGYVRRWLASRAVYYLAAPVWAAAGFYAFADPNDRCPEALDAIAVFLSLSLPAALLAVSWYCRCSGAALAAIAHRPIGVKLGAVGSLFLASDLSAAGAAVAAAYFVPHAECPSGAECPDACPDAAFAVMRGGAKYALACSIVLLVLFCLLPFNLRTVHVFVRSPLAGSGRPRVSAAAGRAGAYETDGLENGGSLDDADGEPYDCYGSGEHESIPLARLQRQRPKRKALVPAAGPRAPRFSVQVQRRAFQENAAFDVFRAREAYEELA